MPRLMSVALTEQAVIERRKTVTRRLGWTHAKPGMPLTLCRKVQGRSYIAEDGSRQVEPIVRLAEVEVVSVRREQLRAITLDDVAREGFPTADGVGGWMAVEAFIEFFCRHMKISSRDYVTRIEWRYLDGEVGS